MHNRDELHNKKGLQREGPEGPRPTPMKWSFVAALVQWPTSLAEQMWYQGKYKDNDEV